MLQETFPAQVKYKTCQSQTSKSLTNAMQYVYWIYETKYAQCVCERTNFSLCALIWFIFLDEKLERGLYDDFPSPQNDFRAFLLLEIGRHSSYSGLNLMLAWPTSTNMTFGQYYNRPCMLWLLLGQPKSRSKMISLRRNLELFPCR